MQKTLLKLEERGTSDDEKTPEKRASPLEKHQKTLAGEANANNEKNISTPLKETKETESKFKTPEKSNYLTVKNQSVENYLNENVETEKNKKNFDLTLEPTGCDGEDGMISTAEQARLLIAANKTPSKSLNKTPVKQNTPSERKSIENSPVTPGKYKRVELITLASPKAKRIKQI